MSTDDSDRHPDHDLLDGWASQRLEELRGRLESIAEEITDLSVDLLREAIEQGASSRPPIDKTLAQARRAVEKAAHLLDP